VSLATAILEEVQLLGVTVEADGPDIVLRPGRKVPAWLLDQVRAAKPELLRELRRREALKMLDKHPHNSRAYVVDADSDPDKVLVLLAIRGVGICDLEIPRDRWQPFVFMQFMETRKQ